MILEEKSFIILENKVLRSDVHVEVPNEERDGNYQL